MASPARHIKFDPEAISIALFNLLTGIPATFTPGGPSAFPFVTFDRKGLHWANVGSMLQPYLMLVEVGMTALQDTALGLTKWRIHWTVVVYIRADAEPGTSVPATQINAAMLAIFDALQSVPFGNKQTLGGLVNNCWIDGRVWIDTGIEDQQCALMIPVTAELGI